MSEEMKPCDISNIDNTLKLTTCGTCDGFYGNNYGQPVCSTCHYFLYNNEDLLEDFQREKSDSGDSGNEEPKAAEDFYTAKLESAALNGSAEVLYDCEYAEAKRDLHFVQTPLQARCDHLSRYSTYHKWNANKDNLISYLPNEVLSKILKFVNSDAVSLLRARSTCSLWQTVIDRITPETYWQAAVRSYWPIFCAAYKISDWKIMFSCLLKSSTCVLCLKEMRVRRKESTDKKQLMWRSKRLMTERKMLDEEPPEGIRAVPLDENMCHWQATINGPDGSVYEGGVFYLHLKVGFEYPVVPPRVRFISKIFHPNISRHGEVGIDLWPNWSLVLTIGKVLVSVQSLLTDPYCFVSMEPKISRLHEDNKTEFDRIAREWTRRYARWTHKMPNWQSNVCFL